jgi:hypothetical protein
VGLYNTVLTEDEYIGVKELGVMEFGRFRRFGRF